MFAEGTRSRDGSVGRAALRRRGPGRPARPAARADPRSGTHEVMPVGRYWMKRQPGKPLPKRHPIEIRFGAPIQPRGRRAARRGDGARPRVLRAGRRRHDPGRARTSSPAPPPPDVGRIFVTGATGFIGGALTTRLLEQGEEIVALARSDASAAKLAGRGIEIVRGNVLDEESLVAGDGRLRARLPLRRDQLPLPGRPEAAAEGQRATGTELVVQAAGRAGVRRVVITSSAASVGEPHGTVGDEHSIHRGTYLSVYDRSKHEGEQAAFAAAHRDRGRARGDLPVLGPGPGAQGRQRQADHRLRQREAAGVRRHLRQRGRHRRLHRGPPARRRARAPRRPLRPQRRDDHLGRGAGADARDLRGPRARAHRPARRGALRGGAARGRLRRRAGAPRPCAAPASGPSCTATATTARWRRASSASSTRRSPRPSAARSNGRSAKGSSPAR